MHRHPAASQPEPTTSPRGRVEKKLSKAQRIYAAICSCARNAYAKEQLKADFLEGLAEMRVQSRGAGERPWAAACTRVRPCGWQGCCC